MDARFQRRVGNPLILSAVLATLLTSPGCVSGLTTALWLLNGNNGPVEYKGLKDKQVAIVCRPTASLQYRNRSVAQDIARQVGVLLSENGRRIKLVDQRKVEQWIDENTWDEYTEVGKAMKADVVVGIDLDEFSIYNGQTVFQGKASASMRVFDCETGEVLFEKNLSQITYPPNHVIPAQDIQEDEFRRRFVKIVAEQFARVYYAHDRHSDMGLDVQAFDF